MTDTAIASLKVIYSLGNVKLDDLFGSIVAVTRPSKDIFHVCFEMFGIRSFMDVRRSGDRLIGVSVQRV